MAVGGAFFALEDFSGDSQIIWKGTRGVYQKF